MNLKNLVHTALLFSPLPLLFLTSSPPLLFLSYSPLPLPLLSSSAPLLSSPILLSSSSTLLFLSYSPLLFLSSPILLSSSLPLSLPLPLLSDTCDQAMRSS